MATPEYINTLVTKFAAARATRLNLVKQAGMVPPADRAARADSWLAGRGYDNASGSHIFRLDPSYSSLLHPTQLSGDLTVDALDQSWSNPDRWTQNLADYGVSAGLGGLAGNKFNKILNGINFSNNGIPTKIPISQFNDPALRAFLQYRAGDGKGSTSFSVSPTPPGWKGLLTEQVLRPQMRSESTPAMDADQRLKAVREAMATTPRARGQTAVQAPLEVETVTEAKPQRNAVAAIPATYDGNTPPNRLTESVPGTPFEPGEKAVVRQVRPKNWANTGASTAASNTQPITIHAETTTPSKGLTGKPQDKVTRQQIRPNELATNFNNRLNGLKYLSWGALAGAGANALKNFNNNGSLWAATKMPVSFDGAGDPTPATQRRMDEDAANAARR